MDQPDSHDVDVAAQTDETDRNAYEIARDEFAEIKRICASSDIAPLGWCFGELILGYVAPYVCQWMPYEPDSRQIARLGRAISAGVIIGGRRFVVPPPAVDLITAFLLPRIVVTEPIPCAITTLSHIANFDYDQHELITAIKARGAAGLLDARILSVCNRKGAYFAHHGEAKSDSAADPPIVLFGTSQTTFRVKTAFREPDKEFAVKVFQKNVSLETLGGLWVDCRDTRDVNNTVLIEMRAALNKPGLAITSFCASMRNYRFKLAGSHNVHLYKLLEVFQRLHATTCQNMHASVDISRHPSAIVEISVPRHTSRKKKVVIKIFQSGKINIDSCVHYEHVYDYYRFINEFLIEHEAEVLYLPPSDDEYESDHYYEEAGIEPPPRCLVDI